MTTGEKKKIPVKEGMWTTATPDGQPQLVGSKCAACGEVYFPRKEKGWCISCQQKTLKDVMLSRKGTIASFSVVSQQPGGGFYKGLLPYAYGYVRLPEGLAVEGLFTGCQFEDLKVGLDVEMVVEKLGEDAEGNEIVSHKFKPVGKK